MSHCSNCNNRSSCCDTCSSCNTCNNRGCNNWNNWNSCNNCGAWNCDNWNWHNWSCWPQTWTQDGSACNRWAQPIISSPAQFANLAQFSSAGTENGATLVIHKIVLEPCGNQSCTPRTYTIRITGPSYPCGETFQLRAGSCTELDEPLVITGLEPGTYCIEEVTSCPHQYISTFTGPVCGQQVNVTNSYFPTVITIVSRRRSCALQRRRCC